MRGRLQKAYDDFYYGFEPWYTALSLRLKARMKYLFKKAEPEVLRAYKNDIRPYWKQFGLRPSLPMMRDLYAVTERLDARYIPDDIWIRYIIPYFNNLRYSRILADKNLNSLLFPTAVKRPETLFKCMSGRYCLENYAPISRDEAIALCRSPGQWVIKPTMDSFQGKNITFFEQPDQPAELLRQYAGTDFIVQRAVRQHPAMAAFNPSSVNTIRIVTYILREEARIESIILRAGTPGSRVDNLGAGGTQYAVNRDGTLAGCVYTKKGGQLGLEVLAESPVPSDFIIPGFQDLCATALSLAVRTPHLCLIAWDFAVDETGVPVLLEFNTHSPGQNQETNGPTFGDSSQEVLGEIFKNRKGKK